MTKLLQNLLAASMAILGTSLMAVSNAQASPEAESEFLGQLNDYELESGGSMEQITSVQ
jgi:hypothetical protein